MQGEWVLSACDPHGLLCAQDEIRDGMFHAEPRTRDGLLFLYDFQPANIVESVRGQVSSTLKSLWTALNPLSHHNDRLEGEQEFWNVQLL